MRLPTMPNAVKRLHGRRIDDMSMWIAVKNGWGLLALGSGLLVAAASCSSEFHACEETRTCPPSEAGTGGTDSAGNGGSAREANGHSGESDGGATGGAPEETSGRAGEGGGPATNAGTAGEAGQAGAGGASTIVPGCKRNEDCDDGLACNGQESCSNGNCVPGAAACAGANPDPTNCDVVCTESGGNAKCTVQGQDKDHDTYLSARCTQSSKPALDCDDSAATTHPGAPELCDGVDNNCNGAIDLADGLSISGTSVQIGATTSRLRNAPNIAWAPDASAYGVAWLDGLGSGGDVWLETFDQSGAIKLAPMAVNNVKTTNSIGLGLAYSGGSFGVAWYDSSPYLNFASITNAGASKIAPTIIGSNFQILSQPQVAGATTLFPNSWAIVWGTVGSGGTAPNEVLGAVISSSGALENIQSDVILGTNAGLAATVGNYAVVADFKGTARGDLNYLTYEGTPNIALTGSSPVVGGNDTGFAIATSVSGSAPKFYAYGATGALVCGPVSFADSTFVPAAITATPTGYLVASSGAVKVVELSASCVPGTSFTVDPGPGATHVGIAGNATGYGIVWQDATSGAPKRRVFGPRFCN